MSHQESADWIMELIAELIPERYRGAYAHAGTPAVAPAS
jgi:hypothetical protein